MDRRLKAAAGIATRVLEHEHTTGEDVDRAAAAIAHALGTVGRTVTSLTRAGSPRELDEAVAQLRGGGHGRLSANLAGRLRVLPTAEAGRRGHPTWEALSGLDAVERRVVRRGVVRLLPFVCRLEDVEAWAALDPGEMPGHGHVTAASTAPGPALRAIRDAWRRHRLIRERALASRELVEQLASAAPHVLGFCLFGRRERSALVVLERPAVSVEAGLAHAWERPAVRWPDGSGEWFWRGIRLPQRLSDRLPGLTAPDIVSLRNVELRRVAVEYLGVERFLDLCGATREAQDDFGTLWRTRMQVGGEPFVAVEIVNATAEPDGTYRRFFVRVPPEMRTARGAVAWTFGFDRAEDYLLTMQT